MIEVTTLKYLISKNITGIGGNVYAEVPENPPAEYILIQKMGSGEINRIDRAMILVQSISKYSLLSAMEIDDLVKKAMAEFANESNKIYSCKLNSDYNNTNTETKEYRYNAVFNIYY